MKVSTNSSAKAHRTSPAPVDEQPRQAAIRFALAGPSRRFDPARQAIRRDLADIAEAEFHFAPHYASPVVWQAVRASCVRTADSIDAEVRAELAVGDEFALLDITGDWAWGYTLDGHVVGYLCAADLTPKGDAG